MADKEAIGIARELGRAEARVDILREALKDLMDACGTTNKSMSWAMSNALRKAQNAYDLTDLATPSDRHSMRDSTTFSE